MARKAEPSGGGVLPRGWRWIALGEIADIVSGQSPTSDTYRKEPAGLPFFQGKADFGQKHPTARVWCVAPKTIAQPGDILISVRAPVGPTNVADVECCIGRGLAAVRCMGDVKRNFILFFMKFHESEISQMGTGSTFAAISRKQLLNTQIPLPPVSEQEKIVGILESEMGAVEKARRAALDRVEAARALDSAFLREALEFDDENFPPGWRWGTLGEVCLEDRRGIDGASSEAAELPYLSLENVESMSGKIILRENSNSRGISNCFRFGPDHILYGKLRPYLNKVALPNFHGRCTTELIPLLPKQNIHREFLALLLRQPKTVDWVMREKTGSRMPRANMKRLMKLEFPLPPLAEQKQIAAALNAKMAIAKQTRDAAEAELEAIEALPGALLRRAFRATP